MDIVPSRNDALFSGADYWPDGATTQGRRPEAKSVRGERIASCRVRLRTCLLQSMSMLALVATLCWIGLAE